FRPGSFLERILTGSLIRCGRVSARWHRRFRLCRLAQAETPVPPGRKTLAKPISRRLTQGLRQFVEDFRQGEWHGQETVPQRRPVAQAFPPVSPVQNPLANPISVRNNILYI